MLHLRALSSVCSVGLAVLRGTTKQAVSWLWLLEVCDTGRGLDESDERGFAVLTVGAELRIVVVSPFQGENAQ